MTINQRIKEQRERLGWTQAALAEAVGMTQANISHIERGKAQELTATTITRIAEALNVSVSYLFGEEPAAEQQWKELRQDPTLRHLVQNYERLSPAGEIVLYELSRAVLFVDGEEGIYKRFGLTERNDPISVPHLLDEAIQYLANILYQRSLTLEERERMEAEATRADHEWEDHRPDPDTNE